MSKVNLLDPAKHRYISTPSEYKSMVMDCAKFHDVKIDSLKLNQRDAISIQGIATINGKEYALPAIMFGDRPNSASHWTMSFFNIMSINQVLGYL